MFRCAVALLISTLLAPLTALAAQPQDLDGFLKALSDPDYAVRQEATAALMLAENLDREQWLRLWRAAGGAEERHRLIRVAMHQYFARRPLTNAPLMVPDRGALGIDLTEWERNFIRPGQRAILEHPAILVSRTHPGFPAFVHLQPGDLITGLEGRSFDATLDNDSFVKMVQVYPPGHILRVEVWRGSQRLTIPMALGSYNRLEEMVQNQLQRLIPPALFAPWEEHLRALLDGETGLDGDHIRLEPKQ